MGFEDSTSPRLQKIIDKVHEVIMQHEHEFIENCTSVRNVNNIQLLLLRDRLTGESHNVIDNQQLNVRLVSRYLKNAKILSDEEIQIMKNHILQSWKRLQSRPYPRTP